MPLAEIKKFLDLAEKGDSTIQERFQMINAQREKAIAELEEMKKRIKLLTWKSNYYRDLLKG